jgi:DedD protein
MPNDPTAEQVEIRRKGRQRLIGAVALALAAVVFVPMVLDPEPRRERVEPILAIPPKDGAPPLATVAKAPEPAQVAPAAPSHAPAAEPAAPKSEVAAPPPPKSEAGTPSPAPARKTVGPKSAEFSSAVAPKSPAPKAASPEPAASEPRPAPAAPKLEGFAVQVGAFREEAKLSQAREKLVAARVPHYTERLDAAGGPLTRLRAGPFPTREAAEKAAVTMKKAGLEGRVVPLP